MSPEHTLRDLLELKVKSGFSGIPITGKGALGYLLQVRGLWDTYYR